MERGFKGGADGVGLHHAAHEAQGQDDGDGEEACQELAETALESGGDVVHGAAPVGAVGIRLPGLDGKGGFGIDGGHAEEGDEPHPENRAGAAGENRTGRAHNVAGAHLGGNSGGQGLEGTHALLVPPAPEGEVAEGLFHTLAEAADLDKAGADGIPQANADEEEHQDVVGEVLVDFCHNGEEVGLQGGDDFCHAELPFSCRKGNLPGDRRKMGRGNARSPKESPLNRRACAPPAVFLCPFA